MQILVIDNNIDPDSWGAPELCEMARLTLGATIHVRRAPHRDLPLHPAAFDRIIISGSKTSVLEEASWISELETFVSNAISQSVPTLGVCYGHQIIARVLGGKQAVRKASNGEFGWARLELLSGAEKSILMRGLPRVFHSFAWHQDEVWELPQDTVALASSKSCPIQAFEHKVKPIFGIQFHPERSLIEGEKSLARRRKENPKDPLINPKLGGEVFKPEFGATLFRNFLELAQK